jgi:chaperonin GroEL
VTSILTGGQFISEDLGLKLENVTPEQLGQAQTVRVEKEPTTTINGTNSSSAPLRRVGQFRTS